MITAVMDGIVRNILGGESTVVFQREIDARRRSRYVGWRSGASGPARPPPARGAQNRRMWGYEMGRERILKIRNENECTNLGTAPCRILISPYFSNIAESVDSSLETRSSPKKYAKNHIIFIEIDFIRIFGKPKSIVIESIPFTEIENEIFSDFKNPTKSISLFNPLIVILSDIHSDIQVYSGA